MPESIWWAISIRWKWIWIRRMYLHNVNVSSSSRSWTNSPVPVIHLQIRWNQVIAWKFVNWERNSETADARKRTRMKWRNWDQRNWSIWSLLSLLLNRRVSTMQGRNAWFPKENWRKQRDNLRNHWSNELNIWEGVNVNRNFLYTRADHFIYFSINIMYRRNSLSKRNENGLEMKTYAIFYVLMIWWPSYFI